jgi:hypothetical protein
LKVGNDAPSIATNPQTNQALLVRLLTEILGAQLQGML